mgnify:CR=1 FL=1
MPPSPTPRSSDLPHPGVPPTSSRATPRDFTSARTASATGPPAISSAATAGNDTGRTGRVLVAEVASSGEYHGLTCLVGCRHYFVIADRRSEEHTSELQSQ